MFDGLFYVRCKECKQLIKKDSFVCKCGRILVTHLKVVYTPSNYHPKNETIKEEIESTTITLQFKEEKI